MKAKEIAAVLNVPKAQRGELAVVLAALVADGKVEVSEKGKYKKADGKFLVGQFLAHPRGFGFVTAEGLAEDIYIPESQVNGAFHKDTVQVAIRSKATSGRRCEGAVTRIIATDRPRILCTYERSKTFGFAVTTRSSGRIFLSQQAFPRALLRGKRW